MKTHFDTGRLAFYRVVVRVFGKETAFRVAAEDPESAQRLARQSYPLFKRPFLNVRWFYDVDPVELTDSGYLQKLKHMHFVQDLETILEGTVA